jgi:hypothetical protein
MKLTVLTKKYDGTYCKKYGTENVVLKKLLLFIDTHHEGRYVRG